MELLEDTTVSLCSVDSHSQGIKTVVAEKGRTALSNFDQQKNVFTTLSLPQPNTTTLPCLPVSKGCIKKMAQTRFVNSSPRSYRLMPASVESSDKTSFVEKSPYSHYLPMKFTLEVAELWEVSKRSELDCNFTLAKSEIFLGSEHYMKEAKQRSPICHSSILPPRVYRAKHNMRNKMDISEEISKAGLGRDLFTQVKRFLETHELKERHPMGIAGMMKMEFQPSKAWKSGMVIEKSTALYCDAISRTGDRLDSNPKRNFPLTPLVKRLSVTGLEKVADYERLINSCKVESISPILSEQREFVKNLPASAKRSKSGRLNDYDEEPLQKRAYCS